MVTLSKGTIQVLCNNLPLWSGMVELRILPKERKNTLWGLKFVFLGKHITLKPRQLYPVLAETYISVPIMLAYICGANHNLPPNVSGILILCVIRDCFTRAGESLCDVNTDFKRQFRIMGSVVRQKWNIITPKWPRLTSTGQNYGDCVTGVAESLLKKACTSSKQCTSIFILSCT